MPISLWWRRRPQTGIDGDGISRNAFRLGFRLRSMEERQPCPGHGICSSRCCAWHCRPAEAAAAECKLTPLAALPLLKTVQNVPVVPAHIDDQWTWLIIDTGGDPQPDLLAYGRCPEPAAQRSAQQPRLGDEPGFGRRRRPRLPARPGVRCPGCRSRRHHRSTLPGSWRSTPARPTRIRCVRAGGQAITQEDERPARPARQARFPGHIGSWSSRTARPATAAWAAMFAWRRCAPTTSS